PPNFYETSGNDNVTISVGGPGDSELPEWVTYDPNLQKFTINPPPGFVGEIQVEVTVEDDQGNEDGDTFSIIINEGEPDTPAAQDATNQSESPTNQQYAGVTDAEIRALWNTDNVFGTGLIDSEANDLSTTDTAGTDLQLASFGSLSGKIQSEQLLRDVTDLVADRS
ncbi:MAG: hypothetical protein AAF213_08565, partial [Pseudomonadota bacterium]